MLLSSADMIPFIFGVIVGVGCCLFLLVIHGDIK